MEQEGKGKMMDIKIEDYLSKEEIKEICKDALYQKIREDNCKCLI